MHEHQLAISVTAITANRLLGKALIRLHATLSPLETSCGHIATANEPLDILQVALVDQPAPYFQGQSPRRRSRLWQALIGLPPGLSFRPQDDIVLVATIGQCLLVALKATPLSSSSKDAAVAAITSTIRDIHGAQPLMVT